MGTPGKGFTGPATPRSQYYVYFPTANGLIAYTLTGIVQMNVQGQATGQDFFRTEFFFDVPIPDLPAGKGLQLVHWAPFVTLNSISNDGVAENAGWAVDDFTVLRPETISASVSIQANLACETLTVTSCDVDTKFNCSPASLIYHRFTDKPSAVALRRERETHRARGSK